MISILFTWIKSRNLTFRTWNVYIKYISIIYRFKNYNSEKLCLNLNWHMTMIRTMIWNFESNLVSMKCKVAKKYWMNYNLIIAYDVCYSSHFVCLFWDDKDTPFFRLKSTGTNWNLAKQKWQLSFYDFDYMMKILWT